MAGVMDGADPVAAVADLDTSSTDADLLEVQSKPSLADLEKPFSSRLSSATTLTILSNPVANSLACKPPRSSKMSRCQLK